MGANKSKNKTTQVQSSSSTNQAVSDSGPISPEQAAAYWGNLLSTGQITPDQLSAAFSGTPEGTAFDTQAGSAGIAGLAGLSGGVGASGGVDASAGMAPSTGGYYGSTGAASQVADL